MAAEGGVAAGKHWVLSTGYSVLSTQYSVLSTQFTVLSDLPTPPPLPSPRHRRGNGQPPPSGPVAQPSPRSGDSRHPQQRQHPPAEVAQGTIRGHYLGPGGPGASGADEAHYPGSAAGPDAPSGGPRGVGDRGPGQRRGRAWGSSAAAAIAARSTESASSHALATRATAVCIHSTRNIKASPAKPDGPAPRPLCSVSRPTAPRAAVPRR